MQIKRGSFHLAREDRISPNLFIFLVSGLEEKAGVGGIRWLNNSSSSRSHGSSSTEALDSLRAVTGTQALEPPVASPSAGPVYWTRMHRGQQWSLFTPTLLLVCKWVLIPTLPGGETQSHRTKEKPSGAETPWNPTGITTLSSYLGLSKRLRLTVGGAELRALLMFAPASSTMGKVGSSIISHSSHQRSTCWRFSCDVVLIITWPLGCLHMPPSAPQGLSQRLNEQPRRN